MIVDIENAEQGNSGRGWSGYSLGRDNEREHAMLILGDTQLGDAICESVNYKSGSYVRFVVSFTDEDNVAPEQGRMIVKDWFKEYMTGFDADDEYHLDIVEHQDTKLLHYHGRIPKVNLLTNTQLKPYYHKADLNYKIAVNEVIAEKYNLTLGTDHQRLVIPPQEKEKRIAKLRNEHGQKPFYLSTKKSRAVAEEGIADLINDLNTQGLVNSLDDVKVELTAMDFEIVNEGYDKGKGFHYVTIQQGDNKLRLKGDTYGAGFYEYSREDRAKAISDNLSIGARSGSDKRSRAEVDKTLQKERKKRLAWIDRQYGGARKRAFQRLQELKRQSTQKYYKIEKNTAAISSAFQPYNRYFYGDLGNSLLQPKPDKYRYKQNSYKQRQNVMVSDIDRRSTDSCKQKQRTQRGVENDRITTEAIRRIRNIREAKRARGERLRAKLQADSEKFNREVPTVNEQDIRIDQSRTTSLNSVVAGVREAAERNYRAIEEATEERAVQRRHSEDFSTSISIIRRSVDQFFERIKHKFDRRTQNLIVGVVNIVKKKQLFERGKKKVLSQLRHKKIKLTPRR